MLGTFRLILAACVALSHIGGNWGDIWISVIAVVIFYMISGYAMTGLIYDRFSEHSRVSRFYLERAIRLAPQYYFWFICAIIASLILKWYPYEINLKSFIPYGLFSYITVIPLAMQSYLGSVDALIMPQATTLGIEISFYILSPWILKSRKLSWIASIICLSIFLMTMLEILPSNIFTYYSTPGPMIFYLLGSFLFKKDWLSLSMFAISLVVVLILGLPQRFNMEFLIGLLIGLPTLLFLLRFPANKLDSALGNASYGCYLGHGVVFFGLSTIFNVTEYNVLSRVLLTLCACLIGWLSYFFIEKPTIKIRRKYNEFASKSLKCRPFKLFKAKVLLDIIQSFFMKREAMVVIRMLSEINSSNRW